MKKARQNSNHLKNSCFRSVYRGHETECVVASLLPGRPYLFQVRAFNRVGPGPWSDSLEVVSGAGAPDVPLSPRVTCRSPTVSLIEWNEPSFNGAVVTEYRLQVRVIEYKRFLFLYFISIVGYCFVAKVSFTTANARFVSFELNFKFCCG